MESVLCSVTKIIHYPLSAPRAITLPMTSAAIVVPATRVRFILFMIISPYACPTARAVRNGRAADHPPAFQIVLQATSITASAASSLPKAAALAGSEAATVQRAVPCIAFAFAITATVQRTGPVRVFRIENAITVSVSLVQIAIAGCRRLRVESCACSESVACHCNDAYC